MGVPLLDLATEAVELLRALVAQERPRAIGCGRPLGPDSLLTVQEAARELRMRDADARRLCTALRPVRSDGVRLYRWGDVLDLLQSDAPVPLRAARSTGAGAAGGLPRANLGGW